MAATRQPMFEYPSFFFIIIIIPLILYLFYRIIRNGKTTSEPTNWPVIGMLPAVMMNLRRAHDYATEVLTECGGTYAFKGPWFCNIDMLFTSDPADIHHIFTKNFSNYPKGPEFRKIFDVLGDGIFNADFELWEIHRRTTLSLLTRPDFSTSLATNVWGKVEAGLNPVLDYFSRNGNDVDLQDIFQRFTFDVICKFVLDFDPCSLSIELPHVPCEKAFNLMVEPLLHRHVLPEALWRLQRWARIGNERRLLEASEAFREFIYPRVGDRGDRQTVMSAFRKAYHEKNIGPEKGLTTFLKDTALSLMLAGRDTTSACLTWLFWLLATNPSAERKVLEEMEREIFKSGKWRVFTAQEAGKLMYLHGALCESLRLFPPVALEHKAPVRPDVLPSGHKLGPDAKVIVCFYSMGRMEAIWGEDCLEFKPERWIVPGGGVTHVPSYKFPAFNVGPRTCLGKEMAFVQMKMVAAAVIYRYRVELVEGHVVAPRDSIILQARNGLKVRLSKRNATTQS